MRWYQAAVPTLALVSLVAFFRRPNSTVDIYTLQGGEIIAFRSLHTGRYLNLDEESGQVYANAEDSSAATSQWQVLVLDADTVRMLARSARSIDSKSEKFTGRRMRTASGCACSGFSNAHGLGRFCHPWEDQMQESWCYVDANCTSAAARGSFGRKYETCDKPYEEPRQDQDRFAEIGQGRLAPSSGCNCSGYSNTHGFGAYCKGWEYEGQAAWCYLDTACSQGGAPRLG